MTEKVKRAYECYYGFEAELRIIETIFDAVGNGWKMAEEHGQFTCHKP